MKLHFLIFSFFSILFSFQTKCQPVSTETFALSKYLFEKDANALNPLSTIIPSSQKKYTYFISGKNASGLSIKGNEIFVKDKFQKKFFQQQQIKFSIAIKEDKKVISKKSFTLLQNNFYKNLTVQLHQLDSMPVKLSQWLKVSDSESKGTRETCQLINFTYSCRQQFRNKNRLVSYRTAINIEHLAQRSIH